MDIPLRGTTITAPCHMS